MSSSDHDPNALSVRVNSARMPKFLNKHVRLPCKVLKLSGDSATVQASDGGEVNVHLLPNEHITETYVEIIGKVVEPTMIQMLACINLGPDLDLKLVNDTIELIHDSRFYGKMFS
ncbi:uncharacterized protein LACBIDRAFT_297715 [Laccaria bicolor S238N-H82]|uniref:Predicted protein n=1 Tax=Laccaria bicolor (strain S238N-H82 / ATCC MYA-4686) TaxID=486041 RepID=B0DAP3_LACBS|nr:uncharacterized protein LACBIDRAFT_297715 [Laccaria bicolor S238N-H82]EDR08063.1 predicted protein [Laccaria bicolor S238N-H82]|eukprot:XP_001881133.1 predicted protein [Laccaria bicolor S238N-H82]